MIAENDIILQKMTLYYKKACTFFILTIKLIDNKELSFDRIYIWNIFSKQVRMIIYGKFK